MNEVVLVFAPRVAIVRHEKEIRGNVRADRVCSLNRALKGKAQQSFKVFFLLFLLCRAASAEFRV